jgi:hypothetical protein
VFLIFKKRLTKSNICKGFKTTRIWPLNPATIEHKMQPSIQFMETTVLEHEVMDFQVEKILGECTSSLKPNACQFNMWKLIDNVLHLNKKVPLM